MAFHELHDVGRDDLIFSRFMSTSFIDEKEMGQYLTPPEVVRFMVEVGFESLSSPGKQRLLERSSGAGVILDPSCGVGSFLAEATRCFYQHVRRSNPPRIAVEWLSTFVSERIVGVDNAA